MVTTISLISYAFSKGPLIKVDFLLHSSNRHMSSLYMTSYDQKHMRLLRLGPKGSDLSVPVCMLLLPCKKIRMGQ